MRLAFEEILEGHEVNSNTRMSRGWKLLMLLPRMMLHRPSRGGHITCKQLEERFRRFQEGVVEFAPRRSGLLFRGPPSKCQAQEEEHG